ncbi:MAG TPA: transcription antitermination factor NusB [Acidimicrobiales bacterium]|jgi:N utilization substance protein B|nr:transcription antitermination factor NusB [Acidimicrobiales bacterium]HJM97112.1 transcription antitermination factor NusB [Acidimicrobiales bacterium]
MMTENVGQFPDRTPSYIIGRRQSRETLLGLLYEYASKSEGFKEIVEQLPLEPDGYAKELASALLINLEVIDAKISEVSHSWELGRMPAVDLAILRIAVLEILRFPSVPAVAIVSEAVELASMYSTETAGPFINGVLAEICRQLRPDESVSTET